MRILSRALPMALFCLLTTAAAAQTTDSTTTAPTLGISRKTTEPSNGSGTLIKVGTGLTRGLSTSYWGLSVPVVVGAEHHLTPTISVYGNGFAGVKIGRGNRLLDGSRPSPIGDYGFDVGVKYYYNQEKRRQKGRQTSPFVGNYLSLQSSSAFTTASFRTPYNYSTLTVQWGMQRRLGKYGWFDAYVGAGLGRDAGYTYYDYTGPRRQAPQLGIATELGIKFSLGKVVK
ncbi:hypothetical protein [Hymenobacter sp. UYP22]|uniref:hypothetical protein n=1 Tax=Hymenobacter sp. UYP22 TaxID=3156348 RepID=UPI00339247EE